LGFPAYTMLCLNTEDEYGLQGNSIMISYNLSFLCATDSIKVKSSYER
jgi:hypothetical protein